MTVALGEPIDPTHAPHPTNDSERLLFRQIYETLLRADCHGHLLPGLANGWRLDSDGRTWILSLRKEARYSDGMPLTAANIRAGWVEPGTEDALRPRVRRLVESVAAIDDTTLAITLRARRAELPIALAHTDLAIARPTPETPWPLGTREDRATAARDTSRSPTAAVITIARDGRSPLRFLNASSDPRDRLDQPVDLLLTRDASALAYAVTLPQFQSVPLAWDRTLALTAPSRPRSTATLPVDARDTLAKDAVRGEARGALGPFWWEMVTDCPVLPPATRAATPFAPRIVYDRADDAARDVAERFVAVVRAPDTSAALLDLLLPDRPSRTYQRTAALTGEALSRARRLGNDAGYLMALDARPLDPCRELQVLTEALPWLEPQAIVPLVETRPRAVVRKGVGGLTAEWDGGLQIASGGGPK